MPRREIQSPGVRRTARPTATPSRSLLWRLEHGSGADPVCRPLVSPGFLRNAFPREETDALTRLLQARIKTPARRGRAGLSRRPWPWPHRCAQRSFTLTSASAPRPQLLSLRRAQRRGCLSKFYLKHSPVPKRRRITLCISKRSIIGMEESEKFLYSQRGKGRDAKYFHLPNWL